VSDGPLVVRYDGTDGGRAALGEAVRLAGPLGAEIVATFAYAVSPLGGEVADMAAVLHERGDELTREALQTARDAGVEGRAEVRRGRPADVLAAVAESEAAQMIVVGSYGEGPLKSFVLGGTAHRIAHVTTVPVLIVRPQR
jgi:nucleotide-binding universal stress UspA family protein